MTEQTAEWDKAHRKLKREVRRAHKRDRQGTGEDDARVERRTFRKRRKQLRQVARREKRAMDALNDIEAAHVVSWAIYALED